MELLVLGIALILARVATFVAILPIFGGRGAPRLVKAGLAVALTILWSGSWSNLLGSDLLTKHLPISWLGLSIALGREIILGAVLGFGLGLFLVPARIAGEYIGQEMGLTLGSLSDPTSDQSSTAIGGLFEMMGIVIFLGLDGHHLFLATLHGSFARWPIGGATLSLPMVELITGAATAQEMGLLVAAPVALCLFLTTVALALMARAVPQLNLITFGFALRLGVGLLAVLLLLPNIVAALISGFGRITEFMARLV